MELLHTQEMKLVALDAQWWDQINDAMEGYSNGVACLNLRIQGGCMLRCEDKTKRLHVYKQGHIKMLKCKKKQAVCLNTRKQRLKLTLQGGSTPKF